TSRSVFAAASSMLGVGSRETHCDGPHTNLTVAGRRGPRHHRGHQCEPRGPRRVSRQHMQHVRAVLAANRDHLRIAEVQLRQRWGVELVYRGQGADKKPNAHHGAVNGEQQWECLFANNTSHKSKRSTTGSVSSLSRRAKSTATTMSSTRKAGCSTTI